MNARMDVRMSERERKPTARAVEGQEQEHLLFNARLGSTSAPSPTDVSAPSPTDQQSSSDPRWYRGPTIVKSIGWRPGLIAELRRSGNDQSVCRGVSGKTVKYYSALETDRRQKAPKVLGASGKFVQPASKLQTERNQAAPKVLGASGGFVQPASKRYQAAPKVLGASGRFVQPASKLETDRRQAAKKVTKKKKKKKKKTKAQIKEEELEKHAAVMAARRAVHAQYANKKQKVS